MGKSSNIGGWPQVSGHNSREVHCCVKPCLVRSYISFPKRTRRARTRAQRVFCSSLSIKNGCERSCISDIPLSWWTKWGGPYLSIVWLRASASDVGWVLLENVSSLCSELQHFDSLKCSWDQCAQRTALLPHHHLFLGRNCNICWLCCHF